ncbi:hypothetical protein [Acinetobacter ursingii]|uniref:hypothetical protein n=1 Tax=Acinetobacter ursingii TaxID=108980 RepID=UPI0011B05B3B|nr:hypothetical protein [Acinetobacter ursingii]
MNISDLMRLIKNAMNLSLGDILLFTDNPINGIQAEYLFTVNVAKEIAKLNQENADPYTIFLEQPTLKFARQCLPSIVQGKSEVQDNQLTDFQRMKARKERTRLLNFKQVNKEHRTGKIDIAVYKKSVDIFFGKYQPVCAIELKSFNPPKNKIIADLERNLFFLNLKGNTGESMLNCTFFAALHWNKKISVENDEKQKEILNEKYEKITTPLKLNNPHIIVHKEIFSLSKSIGEIEIEHIDIENDKVIESIHTSTKHNFMGTIICFERNSQNL